MLASGSFACTARGGTPFEGVWQEHETLVTRRDGSVFPVHPEASLYVVTRTHYAMMATFGVPPRPLFLTLNPTDSEKVLGYDTFWGHSGQYELVGDTLVLHPVVARMPNLMAGGVQRLRLRADGDSLWLTGNFTDYYFRVGDRLVADSSGPFIREQIQLVRVR